MKYAKLTCVLIIMASLLAFTGCDQMLDDILNEGVQVSVEEPLFEGQDTSPTMTLPIVQDLHISKSGGVGKVNFQEVTISLSQEMALVLAQDASQISFEGTLENNGASPVQFKLYLSPTSGLSDPGNQATLIATKVLSVGSNVISGLGSFNESASTVASNLESFFTTNYLIDKVYVYLDAVGSGDIDVLVGSLDMELGASLIKSYTLNEGELSQYSNQVEAIESVSFSGTMTNNGAAEVLVQVYINAVGGQKIVELTLAPGETITLSEDNVYFVSGGEAALENSLKSLMDNPAVTSITYYMFMASADNIDVSSNIVMNGSVTVTL